MAHISSGCIGQYGLSWEDLHKHYADWMNNIDWPFDKEHCDMYDNLSLEEKILVDNNMEYLKEHSKCLNLSWPPMVEETLIMLLDKEKDDKRNREQSSGRTTGE